MELTSRSLDNPSFLSILRFSLRITVVETFHPSFTIEIERSGVETFNIFRVQEPMSQNENSCISVFVPPDVRPSHYWHSLCEKSITRCVWVDKFLLKGQIDQARYGCPAEAKVKTSKKTHSVSFETAIASRWSVCDRYLRRAFAQYSFSVHRTYLLIGVSLSIDGLSTKRARKRADDFESNISESRDEKPRDGCVNIRMHVRVVRYRAARCKYLNFMNRN